MSGGVALSLPDELWRQILENGTRDSKFTYKDLCCISISCRRLHRLSCEDSLWSHLLSSDFPRPSHSHTILTSSASAANRFFFLLIKVALILFLLLLFMGLSVFLSLGLRKKEWQKLQLIGGQCLGKRVRLLSVRGESMRSQAGYSKKMRCRERPSLSCLTCTRSGKHVWQPAVVRGRQKELVEQCPVPFESRVHSLEMDLSFASNK